MLIADKDKNFDGKGETQCGVLGPRHCSKCLTWAARGVLPTVLYSRSHYCLHFPDRDAGSRSHEAPRQGHTCTLSPCPTLPSSLTLKRTGREGRDCDNPAQTHPGQASLDQKCTLGSSSVIRGSGPPARPSPHLVRAELRSHVLKSVTQGTPTSACTSVTHCPTSSKRSLRSETEGAFPRAISTRVCPCRTVPHRMQCLVALWRGHPNKGSWVGNLVPT